MSSSEKNNKSSSQVPYKLFLTPIQKTTRNCGALDPVAGKISQRQGSSSSETGQYPASVTLSTEAATDPNSKTVISAGGRFGRETSTAPFMPGTSGLPDEIWGFGSGFWVVLGVSFLSPFHHDRIPMAIRYKRVLLHFVMRIIGFLRYL